jgi:hypothetical protein
MDAIPLAWLAEIENAREIKNNLCRSFPGSPGAEALGAS